MICALCGLELKLGAVRCPRCGAEVDMAGRIGSSLPPPPAPISEVDDRTTLRPRVTAEIVPPPELPAVTPVGPVAGPPPAAMLVPPPVPVVSAVPTAGFGAPLSEGRQFLPRASAGARLGAYLLDGVILTVGVYAVLGVGLLLVAATGSGSRYSSAASGPATIAFALLEVLVAAAAAAYVIVLNGRGQTLGKKALRIAVVDVQTGQPIGSARAFVRYLMLMVMALPCYLGFLSIPMSAERRGWHDMAANDVVVCLPT